LLSVAGKLVENKLENIITGMLYLAHNRIGLTVWHMGCSYYLCLPSVKLPCICLGACWHWLSYFQSSYTWFNTTLWQDKAVIWLWKCLALLVRNPWSWVHLLAWKNEAGDVRRRNCLV